MSLLSKFHLIISRTAFLFVSVLFFIYISYSTSSAFYLLKVSGGVTHLGSFFGKPGERENKVTRLRDVHEGGREKQGTEKGPCLEGRHEWQVKRGKGEPGA